LHDLNILINRVNIWTLARPMAPRLATSQLNSRRPSNWP